MSLTADTLLLFGATGDLARRMLLPSLCALDADKLLPEGLRIVGTARSPMSDAEFRNFARAAVERCVIRYSWFVARDRESRSVSRDD